MKVWLINPYVHIPGEAWREGRSSHLARELSGRGHEVTLWTGNFSHHFKAFRTEGWSTVEVCPGYTIELVPSNAYQRNIGVGRLAYEYRFAKRMFARASQRSAPDIIVAHDPPQVNGHYGLKLARLQKVPLVIDTVDLWPEFFVRAMPRRARPIAEVAAQPLYAWRKRNWRRAQGYTSLAKPYLDVVHEVADPKRLKPSVVAYNGIDVAEFRSHLNGKTYDGLPKHRPDEVRAVFAGTLGPSYDIPAILEAAKRAKISSPNISFVIAGDGPYKSEVEATAKELGNLFYVGKLPVDKLVKLYSTCDVGLCAYGPFSNVEMPDKVYDYTAAGLAVVNSLKGEVREFIESEGFGSTYAAGDGADLLRHLTTLATYPEQLRVYKERSWAVGDRFDNGRQIAGLADMLEQVAGSASEPLRAPVNAG
jgi:glycosyltransferase involved in cell wall biosynthesis